MAPKKERQAENNRQTVAGKLPQQTEQPKPNLQKYNLDLMLSDNTRSFSGNKFLYFGKFDNFAYLQAGWKRHTCPHQISVFICG